MGHKRVGTWVQMELILWFIGFVEYLDYLDPGEIRFSSYQISR